MFICHVALQGCLTLQDVPYGLTADTGGHIKYLLELADASAKEMASRSSVSRQLRCVAVNVLLMFVANSRGFMSPCAGSTAVRRRTTEA